MKRKMHGVSLWGWLVVCVMIASCSGGTLTDAPSPINQNEESPSSASHDDGSAENSPTGEAVSSPQSDDPKEPTYTQVALKSIHNADPQLPFVTEFQSSNSSFTAKVTDNSLGEEVKGSYEFENSSPEESIQPVKSKAAGKSIHDYRFIFTPEEGQWALYNSYNVVITSMPEANSSEIEQISSEFSTLDGNWKFSINDLQAVDTGEYTAKNPHITHDSKGNARIIWQQNGSIISRKYSIESKAWSEEAVLLSSPDSNVGFFAPTVAGNTKGDIVVIMPTCLHNEAKEYHFYARHYNGSSGGWNNGDWNGEFVGSAGNLCRKAEMQGEIDYTNYKSYVKAPFPRAIMDKNGDVFFTWIKTLYNDDSHLPVSHTIYFRKFDAETKSWGSEEVLDSYNHVSGASYHFPQISVNQMGQGALVWVGVEGSLYQIKSRLIKSAQLQSETISLATGKISDMVDLSFGSLNPRMIPDFNVGVGAKGNVVILWTERKDSSVSLNSKIWNPLKNEWIQLPVTEGEFVNNHMPVMHMRVEIAANDEALAIWKGNNGDAIFSGYYQGGQWKKIENLDPTGDLFDSLKGDGVSLVMDKAGNGAVSWFRINNNKADTLVVRRFKDGAWSSSGDPINSLTITFGQAALGSFQMSINDAGQIANVWEGQHENDIYPRIWANFFK